MLALGWPSPRRRAYRLEVDLQYIDDPAQGVAVHPEVFSSPKLIALPLLQDPKNEALLELTHRLRILNAISK
ncbi:MAG: hypothetical protein WCA19_27205, partial [Candidatus Acidiferrales bacterium]